MKRLLVLVTVLLVFAGIGLLVSKNNTKNVSQLKTSATSTSIDETPHEPVQSINGSIFIPYWTVSNASSYLDFALPTSIDHETLDYLMYFGITPNETGIDKSEPGYASLQRFVDIISSQETTQNDVKTLLTIRMINEDINRSILEDRNTQISIAQEAIDIASNNGFKGIVLDLEHSVLPTESITTSITEFIQLFSEETRSKDLYFAITLYGDTFYRARPYNVREIEPHVDQIMIMTYDFHKSFGTPGPNFPLEKGDLYDYSLTSLIDDLYEHNVTPEKLTFIFGLYGYEWLVDDENRPIKRASAVTLNQAQSRFNKNDITKDPVSRENTTEYTDDEGRHVVWFESEESAQEKANYLKSMGISRIGYWAWGYY